MLRTSVCGSVLIAALFAAPPIATQPPHVAIVRVPNRGIQPQAVMDDNGTLHLVYYVGDRMKGDLFYVKSSNRGASWSEPLRVNNEAGTAMSVGTIRGGQIAIGRRGRIHVAWNGSAQAESTGPLNPESGKRGSPMLYTRLNDTGTAFEPERNLMTHTYGLDGGGAVAADPAGNVYVAWHGKAPGAREGEAGRQVFVAVSRDDGQTFEPEKPASDAATGACGCCGLAIHADTRGTVRVLYRSATENVHRDIYVLTSDDHGRTFTTRKLHEWNINACPMSSMSFAEANGRVEGAWETAGQIYFDNLSAANAAPAQAPGDERGRKHPRLALGPNGTTLLLWTEGTGWNRGGSLAWQPYQSDGTPLGETRREPGLPAWSFGAVVATATGFIVIY